MRTISLWEKIELEMQRELPGDRVTTKQALEAFQRICEAHGGVRAEGFPQEAHRPSHSEPMTADAFAFGTAGRMGLFVIPEAGGIVVAPEEAWPADLVAYFPRTFSA